MIFNDQDAEDVTKYVVLGLATVLLNQSDLTDKQIRRLRAHDIFASLMKALYKQRKAFVEEARVLFRVGPDKYLRRTTKRTS